MGNNLTPVYSTGRGGRGNLAHATHEKDELEPSFSNSSRISSAFKHDKEGNVVYSTGRGGAGNFKSAKEVPSPTLSPDPETTNSLQPVFSTGRGGYGNFVKSGEISPIASKDYENPPNIKADTPVHTGRGGAGNIVNPTSSSEPKQSNKLLSKLKKLFN